MIKRFTIIGAAIGAAIGVTIGATIVFTIEMILTVRAYTVSGMDLVAYFLGVCIISATVAAVGAAAGLIVGIVVSVFPEIITAPVAFRPPDKKS